MISLEQILKNRKKVLGRNERSLNYIVPYNSKKAKRIADDKVLSKKVLLRNNIPVPTQLGVIESFKQIEDFDFDSLPKSFVVKPVKGARGGGVEIFYNRDSEGRFIRADRSKISLEDLKAHIKDILEGKFSLFNEPDRALLEERVKPHASFKNYTYKGTPDVRVIIFNHMPIMSYVRLPTLESDGKANLDLGAVGAGIDIAVGKTTSAIIGKSQDISYVPGTKTPLSGLKIPFWNKILKYAVETSFATNLGFGGIDFLIDKELGPVIVELNARPGLSIQLANDDGLRWRLRKAKGIKIKSVDQAIRLAKDLFGGEIEEEIEMISGKEVIGLIVDTVIYSADKNSTTKIKAKVDTGATITSLDKDLARRMGYGEAIDFAEEILKDIPKDFDDVETAKKYSEEHNLNQRLEEHPLISGTAIIKAGNGIAYRISVKMKFVISNIEIESAVTLASRKNLSYPMIIGERDLKKFLIDPSKKFTKL